MTTTAGESWIDFDQHYYEPDDCCTRYLEPRFRDRAVHVREHTGERAWFFGDRPLDFDRRPNDFVLEPGELRRLFSLRLLPLLGSLPASLSLHVVRFPPLVVLLFLLLSAFLPLL